MIIRRASTAYNLLIHLVDPSCVFLVSYIYDVVQSGTLLHFALLITDKWNAKHLVFHCLCLKRK